MLPAILVVWAVMASMQTEREAHKQLLKAQKDATTVHSLASEFSAWKTRIDSQQAATKSYTKPLLDDVTESAAQHGLVLSDISTSGEQRLSARVEDAVFEEAVSWLYDLYAQHATQIGNTTFQRSRESGKVNIQTTLYRE
jgi:type II secretory pathway component PulM